MGKLPKEQNHCNGYTVTESRHSRYTESNMYSSCTRVELSFFVHVSDVLYRLHVTSVTNRGLFSAIYCHAVISGTSRFPPCRAPLHPESSLKRPPTAIPRPRAWVDPAGWISDPTMLNGSTPDARQRWTGLPSDVPLSVMLCPHTAI